jgi:WD40 repeat protein
MAQNGGVVATGDDSGVVRLWDVGRAKVVRRLELGDRVWAVRFKPDGRSLAAAGQESSGQAGEGAGGIVRLWNVGDFSLERELRLELPAILLEFTPDGRKLAAVSDVIDVFDLATGRKEVELPGHQEETRAIAFSRDGKALVSAGRDMKFRIWDLATSRLAREIAIEGHRRSTSTLHPQPPDSLAFAVFGPDLATAATSGFGDQVLAWDLRAGRKEQDEEQGTVSSSSRIICNSSQSSGL